MEHLQKHIEQKENRSIAEKYIAPQIEVFDLQLFDSLLGGSNETTAGTNSMNMDGDYW